MRKIKFRFILSLFFLIITLASIGFLIWILAYQDNNGYGELKSIFLSKLAILLILSSSILSLIFYKFNKVWARGLLYFLLLSLTLYYFFNSYIYKKSDSNSENYFIELPRTPNPSLPANCLVLATIGDSKSISMFPTNCAGDSCVGDINLTPIKIINSAEDDVKSSTPCSSLNGTTQYVEILADGIKNGQKVKAEIDYRKEVKYQNVYYLYKLINVTIIEDK